MASILEPLLRKGNVPQQWVLQSFNGVDRISCTFPGENPAGLTEHIGVSEFFRPDGTVVASGAFNKAAIEYNRFVFIRAKQCFELLNTFTAGFLGVPFFHLRNGKKKLFCAGNMIFFV